MVTVTDKEEMTKIVNKEGDVDVFGTKEEHEWASQYSVSGWFRW